MPINTEYEKRIFFSLGILSLFTYACVIYSQAINMPKWDDYVDILAFLNKWILAATPTDILNSFFYHTNEHILLVNHFVILFQYYLIGHLNFAWLIYVGNLFFIGSSLALWLFYNKNSESLFSLAIICLLGINFYSYESTLWAMTSISNQAVIFFSFLSIYSATKKNNLSLVVIFSFFAIFSQSNGLILLPLIGIYCWLNKKGWLFRWICFSLIILALYFYFINSGNKREVFSAIATLTLKEYLLTIPTFFSVLGGTLFSLSDQIETSISKIILASLAGLCIFTFFIYQLKNKKYSSEQMLLLSFLLLTIASIAFYRGLNLGPQIGFVSRYKMYACYFLIVAIFLSPTLMEKIRHSTTWRYSLIVFAALIYCLSFYLNLPHSKLINSHLKESLQFWVEDGDFRRNKGLLIKNTDSYLFPAMHQGLWSPLTLISPEKLISAPSRIQTCPTLTTQPEQEAPFQLRIEHINRNAPGIRISIDGKLLAQKNKSVNFLLCSPTYSFRAELPANNTASTGNVFYLPAQFIPPETYQLHYQINRQWFSSLTKFKRKSNTR